MEGKIAGAERGGNEAYFFSESVCGTLERLVRRGFAVVLVCFLVTLIQTVSALYWTNVMTVKFIKWVT